MRQFFTLCAALAAAWAMGCAGQPELRPAPEAERIRGQPQGAMASSNGIVLEARVDAWRGQPREIDEEVTPILVRLDNGSRRPVKIRHEYFQLVTPDGRVFAAKSPFDVRGEVSEYAGAYGSVGVAYLHSPYYHYPYFGFRHYYYPWGGYYGGYHNVYVEYDLPSNDMLVRAMPEGVLEPQGRVTGFVYFLELDDIEPLPGRVELRLKLMAADRGEQLGTLVIPFQIVED